MAAQVISVNVGAPTVIGRRRGREVRSGIVKRPVAGAVMIRRTNLDGDGQADLTVHGGESKAVYCYAAEDYAWWSAELGRQIAPATFGENLTIAGLGDADVRVGQHVRAGGALLAVTVPREPCFKLGMHMGDPRFLKRFLHADRTGWYARVVEEGPVRAGDPVEALPPDDPDWPTISEVHRLYAHARDDRSGLSLLAVTPGLPEDWRDWALERLAAT
ncbi:MAG: MOSC domain-containing protein [Thermoleophilia bacterium]|jgi:MOSC domain-containing protein YiiM|nr:MOSC domain-containing protein [Thermoleophilia bacterium]